jgi:predicted  nucleic acid-binding Zn-ribbon protein
MAKKGRKAGVKKKKEIFFNFVSLRKNLTDKQKDKLINFYKRHRETFKELQKNLFELNKKFDTLETEWKNFQLDVFNNEDNNKNNENEIDFILNQNQIDDLFANELANEENNNNNNNNKNMNNINNNNNVNNENNNNNNENNNKNEIKEEEFDISNNLEELRKTFEMK